MFSYAIDGTVAGLVAGSLVTGRLRLDKVLSRSKKLAIRVLQRLQFFEQESCDLEDMAPYSLHPYGVQEIQPS